MGPEGLFALQSRNSCIRDYLKASGALGPLHQKFKLLFVPYLKRGIGQLRNRHERTRNRRT